MNRKYVWLAAASAIALVIAIIGVTTGQTFLVIIAGVIFIAGNTVVLFNRSTGSSQRRN